MFCGSFRIRVALNIFTQEHLYSINLYTSARKAYFRDSTTREQSNCRREHKMEKLLDRRWLRRIKRVGGHSKLSHRQQLQLSDPVSDRPEVKSVIWQRVARPCLWSEVGDLEARCQTLPVRWSRWLGSALPDLACEVKSVTWQRVARACL